MATPTLNEGMNNVPPNLGIAFLCILRTFGKSKIPRVLHSFTTNGVHTKEKMRLMANAMMMYVSLIVIKDVSKYLLKRKKVLLIVKDSKFLHEHVTFSILHPSIFPKSESVNGAFQGEVAVAELLNQKVFFGLADA